MRKRIAVLLMAYGGLQSLDDLEPYLTGILRGRQPSADMIKDYHHRYTLIGGTSPITAITREQARLLQECLASAETSGEPGLNEWKIYTGMRYWHPFISETLQDIYEDGFREVLAICMTPHASRLSTAGYQKALKEAVERIPDGNDMQVHVMAGWHDHTDFIKGSAEELEKTLAYFTDEERSNMRILFTAHSQPMPQGRGDERYEDQLRESARLILGVLGLKDIDWKICFQSAPASGWMEPFLEDEICLAAEEGVQCILAAPIGFAATHLEILYDLDLEARKIAQENDMRFERSAPLSIEPSLIAVLKDMILQFTQEKSP